MGDLENGHGWISTESRALAESLYSFGQRVEGEGKDTNPEELLAAAVSSCFAMALSKTLQDEGKSAEKLNVCASVNLNLDDGPKLTDLILSVEGSVSDYSEEPLDKAVDTTAENCPVFRLLKPGFDSIQIESSLRP